MQRFAQCIVTTVQDNTFLSVQLGCYPLSSQCKTFLTGVVPFDERVSILTVGLILIYLQLHLFSVFFRFQQLLFGMLGTT